MVRAPPGNKVVGAGRLGSTLVAALLVDKSVADTDTGETSGQTLASGIERGVGGRAEAEPLKARGRGAC